MPEGSHLRLAQFSHSGVEQEPFPPQSREAQLFGLRKRTRNSSEDRIHDLVDVTLIEMGVLSRELLDQFGFDHV